MKGASLAQLPYRLEGKRIYVAGHRGMVGSALCRRLARENCELITCERTQLDLKRQTDVEAFFKHTRPDCVIMAAGKVGGILANDSYPADFLYDNVIIEANVAQAAHEVDVEKFLFLGSSCIYPRLADQPIAESALLSGPLEPTNEWYAISKITGIKLGQAYRRQFGQDFISAMPTNLYGPGDNFDLNSSHVLPAIIRKVHTAKAEGKERIVVWGTGTPQREFLHCDDCADALVFLLRNYSGFEHINVGSGSDVTILELTQLVCDVIGFKGEIEHDLSKPDGMPRKLMSADKLRAMGWQPSIELPDGIRATYNWFLAQN